MRQFEHEFSSRLDAFKADAVACAAHGYTFFAFEYLAGSDFDVLDRLNEHPSFWQTARASLQSSLFVALGRVFDTGKDRHSAADLLGYVRKYPGVFSRGSLMRRKIDDGLSSEQATEFVSSAFEPSQRSFDLLVSELDGHTASYKAVVEPIRHKVYAHTGKITRDERDVLFTSLPLRELERLTVFPVRLEQALAMLFHDGVEPVLGHPLTIIGEVLKNAPEQWRSTWEHYHRAADTASFLRSLVGARKQDE